MRGNFLQNSALQILDLIGPTGTEKDGLPTSLYFIPDANATQATAFAGTGTTIPGFSNFPANYFTSAGTLAPAPGSPGSLGPPTSVDNWNMGLGIATFKYLPDRHPRSRKPWARERSLWSFADCSIIPGHRANLIRGLTSALARRKLALKAPMIATATRILRAAAANVYQLAGALASRFDARSVIDLGCSSSRSFLASPAVGFHKVGIRVRFKSQGTSRSISASISSVGLGSKELARRGFRRRNQTISRDL